MSSIIPCNFNQDIETLNSFLKKTWSFKSNQRIKKQVKLNDLKQIILLVKRCIQHLQTGSFTTENQILFEKISKRLTSKSEQCLSDLALLSLLDEPNDKIIVLEKKIRGLVPLLIQNSDKQTEKIEALKRTYTLQFSDHEFLTISESIMRLLKQTSPFFKNAFLHPMNREGLSKETPMPLPMAKDAFLNFLSIFYRSLTPDDLEDIDTFLNNMNSLQFFLLPQKRVDEVLKQLVDKLKIEEHDHLIETLLNHALDIFAPREDFPNANEVLDHLTVQWYFYQKQKSKKYQLPKKAASRVEIVDFKDLKIPERKKTNSFLFKKSKTISPLKKIKRFKNLHTLNLENYQNFTNTDLVYIAIPYNLHTLNLSDLNLLNLTSIYQFPNLHTLILSWNDKLSDQAWNDFAILQSLRSLDLTGCNLTDANISKLADHPNLERLNLTDNTQLTDACLEHLKKFQNLQAVNLTGCVNITNEGLAQFQLQRPTLKTNLIDDI